MRWAWIFLGGGLGAGLRGGFTTFSALGLETWRLFEQAAWGAAAGNALGSVVVCGVALGRVG